MSTDADLCIAAAGARKYACVAYSHFPVGAAILDSDGRTWTGCNIESASYGMTICAERVALTKALSEGARRFTCIAVATAATTPTPPCGACRQLLWEYLGDVPVLIADAAGNEVARYRLADLLPHAFGAANIEVTDT
jgi:cytidine deaminase